MTMTTDKLFYRLFKSYAAAVLKLLGVSNPEDYRASSFTFKEIENRRDMIFEKQDGEETVLLETQGYDDDYFLHKTVVGAMLYCSQNNFRGRFRVITMFLEPSHHRAATRLAHHFDGSSGLAFQPSVFIFGQKNLAELEAVNDVRLIPLYPLCRVSPEEVKALAPQWAARIKAAPSLTEKTSVDLLALLGGFVSQRVTQLSLAEINDMFGGFKMENTVVGQELIAMGRRIGISEGQAEGEVLGRLSALREDVLDLLTTRWSAPSRIVLKQLSGVDDPILLKSLFRSLLQAKTRKQMQAALDAVLGNGKNGH